MLTRKQHELIRFIQARLEETGVSPSFEEMKEALDLKSKSGVHRLISALEERGFIRRLPNRARALEVLRQPEDVNSKAPPRAANANSPAAAVIRPPEARPAPANDVIEIPLHGRIAAGVPIEAMETEFPLLAGEYSVRRGSGGNGARQGGDGLVREIIATEPMSFALLTERRLHQPAGAGGGEPGASGQNRLIRGDEADELPPKAAGELEAGDRLRIETPGGGGYGKV